MSDFQNSEQKAVSLALQEVMYSRSGRYGQVQHQQPVSYNNNANTYGSMQPRVMAQRSIPELSNSSMTPNGETGSKDKDIIYEEYTGEIYKKLHDPSKNAEVRELTEQYMNDYRTEVTGDSDNGKAALAQLANQNVSQYAVKLLNRRQYFEALASVNNHPHVPYYCRIVARGVCYGETVAKAPLVPGPIYYKPDPFAFMSRTAHDQDSTKTEISPIRKGNLSNALVCRLSLKHVRSTFPCAVAVRVGSQATLSIGHFTPYNRAEVVVPFSYFSNASAQPSTDVVEFHAVIPAFYNGSEAIDVYMSGREVNDSFGARYPEVTAERKTIVKGCQWVMGKIAVPPRSCILEYIYENAAAYGWPLPEKKPSPISETEDVYITERKIFETAVRKLAERVQYAIPVRNLANLALEFTPLTLAPAAKVEILNERLKRMDFSTKMKAHTLSGKDITKFTGEGVETELKVVQDTYSITFELNTDHVFREGTSLELNQNEFSDNAELET